MKPHSPKDSISPLYFFHMSYYNKKRRESTYYFKKKKSVSQTQTESIRLFLHMLLMYMVM
jgi:hypothetical protein